MNAWKPGHETPKATPVSSRASGGHGRVVAKASSDVADDLEDQHADQDPAGAEPVDRRAARPDHEEADQRRQRRAAARRR